MTQVLEVKEQIYILNSTIGIVYIHTYLYTIPFGKLIYWRFSIHFQKYFWLFLIF